MQAKNERYTPPKWAEFARSVMGYIELDPASNAEANQIIKAERFYTIEDDALNQSWKANTVFLNPPYSTKEIQLFSAKLIEEMPSISECILIVNACTETRWFQSLARTCNRTLFPAERIEFWQPGADPYNLKKRNAYKQAVLYWGYHTATFDNLGRDLGLVFLPPVGWTYIGLDWSASTRSSTAKYILET